MHQTGLLLIAHAPLASALRSVAQHVYPDCSTRLMVLDVEPGLAPAVIEDQARALLAAAPHDEFLVLTDVFGATPCNVAERLADPRRVRVVAGVNVPMLWRVLCYADESADRLAERALTGATQGVIPVHSRTPSHQDQRSRHGQDHRHDQ